MKYGEELPAAITMTIINHVLWSINAIDNKYSSSTSIINHDLWWLVALHHASWCVYLPGTAQGAAASISSIGAAVAAGAVLSGWVAYIEPVPRISSDHRRITWFNSRGEVHSWVMNGANEWLMNGWWIDEWLNIWGCVNTNHSKKGVEVNVPELGGGTEGGELTHSLSDQWYQPDDHPTAE